MANYIKSLAIYFVAYLEINLFYVILKYNLNNLQKTFREDSNTNRHLQKTLIKISLVLVPY